MIFNLFIDNKKYIFIYSDILNNSLFNVEKMFIYIFNIKNLDLYNKRYSIKSKFKSLKGFKFDFKYLINKLNNFFTKKIGLFNKIIKKYYLYIYLKNTIFIYDNFLKNIKLIFYLKTHKNNNYFYVFLDKTRLGEKSLFIHIFFVFFMFNLR